MVAIKEMSTEEKYRNVSAAVMSAQPLGVAFVRERISEEAANDLREAWRRDVKPIPEDAPPDRKYELAYANWIAVASSILALVRERLGQKGIEGWIEYETASLKKAHSGPALLLLGLLRSVAPGRAFDLTARQMAYELQWLTPYSVEIRPREAVFDVPRCKILDYEGADDVCIVGCQSVYVRWLGEQFKARMDTRVEGHRCTVTITPK